MDKAAQRVSVIQHHLGSKKQILDINCSATIRKKMVDHLVLFKFKEGTSQEKIDALTAALKGLPAQLPCIEALTCGPNFSPARCKGYQLALRVTFKDKEALAGYGPSKEHQAVVTEHVLPIAEDIIAVDYEF